MPAPTVISNSSLGRTAVGNRTSTVGEPSAAAAGQHIFVTGNWYASSSVDGGANWSHVDPYSFLQPGPATKFCCDELITYSPAHQIWLWVLQYSKDANGQNVFRVAATPDAAFPGGWHFWDVAPTTVDPAWTGVWFDYPDMALSRDNLYVSFNVFNLAGQWQRAVVMRFPLEAIAAGGAPTLQFWTTTELGGSLRLTQGAGATMYWAGHASTTRLRLFAWPDGQAQVSQWDIDVAPSTRAISSLAPNNVDWLGRADIRITGGAVAAGRITFMWTSGSDDTHPHPYIRVARIDEGTRQVVDQPDIWSEDVAWAYPAAAPNGTGTLGFTAFSGGGAENPSHSVGVRDDAAGAWSAVYAKRGGNSPFEKKWGDYLTCRADAPDGDGWVATGYTLEGGDTETSIQPRVVRFAP
jgi:hypothetical protein